MPGGGGIDTGCPARQPDRRCLLSGRGWAWADGVGVADDPFPELYRLNFTGPAGAIVAEFATTSASFDMAELPADAGEEITLAVSAVGPAALSRAAIATIIL